MENGARWNPSLTKGLRVKPIISELDGRTDGRTDGRKVKTLFERKNRERLKKWPRPAKKLTAFAVPLPITARNAAHADGRTDGRTDRRRAQVRRLIQHTNFLEADN